MTNDKQLLRERVDEMLLAHRKDTLEFAAAFGKEHDARAYAHLVSKVPSGGMIRNDTPQNLKAKASEPGAFFNKRMRPIPFGSR